VSHEPNIYIMHLLKSNRSNNSTVDLVFIIIKLFALPVSSLGANLFVVLLEGSKILTGLGEFTFLHALSDVPIYLNK